MIPVLMIGAFALILNFFPVKGYQEFIATFAGGILSKLFVMVNSATFGPLSVYMTISISRSYISRIEKKALEKLREALEEQE